MSNISKFAPSAFGASALALCTLTHPAAATTLLLNGGAQKAIYAAIGDGDLAFGTPNYSLVPGVSRTINVPLGGDTMVATFTADCILLNSTHVDNFVHVIITDNAVPILPTIAVGVRLAFCSDGTYDTHSIQVAKRLDPGSHAIRVFWKIDQIFGNNDMLVATLQNWAFTIEVSE